MTSDDVVEKSTVVHSTTEREFELLVGIALDLNLTLVSKERYQRLVSAVPSVLPADAVTLLRLEGDELQPLAATGLRDEALGHVFSLADHPRLERVCSSTEPIQFPVDSNLPDPFDGLIEGVEDFTTCVHACLGLPLRVKGELVGVLALDAINPHAFENTRPSFLKALGALAAATLHTSYLADTLEDAANHQRQIAQTLVGDMLKRRAHGLNGTSSSISMLKEEISLFAGSNFPVLISGETGTGKEIVAGMLHRQSALSHKPMVYVNCAALPESVVESELFGHEAGSFTGAHERRLGKFQVADGGCLFLDEIGELPLAVQPKLLRVLQSGEIQRVGSDATNSVNVRVFAATNRNLHHEVEAGRFRSDLLHRLDVCRLTVPPLRERPEDILVLAGQFCDRARRQLGLGAIRLHPEAQQILRSFDWPGNVRELENVISRAALRASRRSPNNTLVLITAQDVGADYLATYQGKKDAAKDIEGGAVFGLGAACDMPLRDAVDLFQRELIQDALQRNDGVWASAARDLGMHRSNLHHLAKRLGLLT
ncbi:MAG: nitric oxide reductase transcriptional regulator NorR [Planctomycetes bacterium]|nr:nitric oxide reductase transcriptional regulator NorR [Planctomycetota bacterium]MCP4770013.1 nitric oxide reductase transcriptional regulator NorR [Planctomycetota bacterium]MCP4859853.1 nitric oxide reductase transcriptional regulator NorR [Planctomycetota bacterium]